MTKRNDIQSIMIIGPGPIVIGQACEFDYSGTQACLALREEGYRTILVNSNPATIMTDPVTADATYIEPITPEQITAIIAKELPDAVLPTMGGQTALNCAMTLAENGILNKYNVELIGAKAEVIYRAEDRLSFKNAMTKIGLECPRAEQVSEIEQAAQVLEHIGLPLVIRPSFTLGGNGSGIANDKEQFWYLVRNGLHASPVGSILIEESIYGWKEFEMEVVRDSTDNCIIVCSIENVDPMGIHTGDSITVAPAQTLTDKEFQYMRSAAIACIRAIGVDTGGANVQFAVNPINGRMLIIEMNPRVSRSSALASKATGFPIAKIAAKLAVGYQLCELQNDITKTTPASFEPSIDYVVTKIPRFAFEKFTMTKPELGTSMRSVGQVMAIGRSFQESLQKAYASLETGLTGLDSVEIPHVAKESTVVQPGITEIILNELTKPTPDRLLKVAEALRRGLSCQQIYQASSIDPWFIDRIEEIVQAEKQIKITGIPQTIYGWLQLKQLGFSDARLATLTKLSEQELRKCRYNLGIKGCFKCIDTCAAEFSSKTSYLYHTFEVDNSFTTINETKVSNCKKVIILGSGPNRISQGIEFDYCCVHAAYALKQMNIESIMINCNPETVSTDYNTADRLYFEPLTIEKILAIVYEEQTCGTLLGVIVQLGGQTPLRLARELKDAGVPILGTSPETIDLAENRKLFNELLNKLDIRQPNGGFAYDPDQAIRIAKHIGFPIIVRPSFVLGGRAMEIVFNEYEFECYIRDAIIFSRAEPILLDHFLDNAIEIDVDAIADGEKVKIMGIMEHIELAGVHSGDSACVIPPYSLSQNIINQIIEYTIKLGIALKVIGLMNIQFAVQQGIVYVIEVNPRASRTIPFVAKATGRAIANIGVQVMAGKKLTEFDIPDWIPPPFFSIKEAFFSFDRFPESDVILGPEMRSTGEVMGHAKYLPLAFYKAQLGAGMMLPSCGTALVSVRDIDKSQAVLLVSRLLKKNFHVLCTQGTAKACLDAGLSVQIIKKHHESSLDEPNTNAAIRDGGVQIVFNTTQGRQDIIDSKKLRWTAREKNIPYFTTITAGLMAVDALNLPIIDLYSCETLQERFI